MDIDTRLRRLEALLDERDSLIDRFAALWAVHGGGSRTWAEQGRELVEAEVRARIRSESRQRGESIGVTELKNLTQESAEYREATLSIIRERSEWAAVREKMSTLDLRIRAEMLRLGMRTEGGEASQDESPDLAGDNGSAP